MAPHSASRSPYLDTLDCPTAFLDWLPNAVLIVDNDGRIAAANDAARSLFAGERPPAVVGRRLANLCSGLANALHLPYFRRDTTTREFTVTVQDQSMTARLQPFFDGQRHLLLMQPR